MIIKITPVSQKKILKSMTVKSDFNLECKSASVLVKRHKNFKFFIITKLK
jgi:hypothetical protein